MVPREQIPPLCIRRTDMIYRKKSDSKVRENGKSKIFHWVTKINGRHLITFTLSGSVHVIYSLLFDWFSL